VAACGSGSDKKTSATATTLPASQAAPDAHTGTEPLTPAPPSSDADQLAPNHKVIVRNGVAKTVGPTTPATSTTASGGGTATSTSTLPPVPDPYEAKVASLVGGFIKQVNTSSMLVSGVAVAIVAPDPDNPSKPAMYLYPFGYTSTAKTQQVTENTQWELGSQTKVFTGTLLADLVNRQQVALADPVQNYAPAGVTIPTVPGAPAMQLLHLGTHTAGLQDSAPNITWNKNNPEGHAQYTQQLLWQSFANEKLESPPGAAWSYSNWGFATLGTIVADKAGAPYGTLITNTITGPLGMTATALETGPTPQMATPICGDVKTPCYWDNNNAYAGAGGLISSIADMAKWMAGNLGYDTPAALANDFALAHKEQIKVPLFSNLSKTMTMGLGWQIYTATPNYPGTFLYKNGGTWAFGGNTHLVPAQRWGVAVLANVNLNHGKSMADLGNQLLQLAPR
jgi:D-alanyl-D-alanine-carboxypeptidase/D-alanyl-D-alanine-endopeptidase